MIFVEGMNLISDVCVIVEICSYFRYDAGYISCVPSVHVYAPRLIAVEAADDGAEGAQSYQVRGFSTKLTSFVESFERQQILRRFTNIHPLRVFDLSRSYSFFSKYL